MTKIFIPVVVCGDEKKKKGNKKSTRTHQKYKIREMEPSLHLLEMGETNTIYKSQERTLNHQIQDRLLVNKSHHLLRPPLRTNQQFL